MRAVKLMFSKWNPGSLTYKASADTSLEKRNSKLQ